MSQAMGEMDVWRRETPPLPFALHLYRQSQKAYMVFQSSTACCGPTVSSEPLDYDLAVRLANEFEMRPVVAR